MYVRQITVPSLCHARVSFLEQLILLLQDWQLPAVSWWGRIPSSSKAPVALETPLPPGAAPSWSSTPVPWRLRGLETTGLDACGASGGSRVPSCLPLCHLQGSPTCRPPVTCLLGSLPLCGSFPSTGFWLLFCSHASWSHWAVWVLATRWIIPFASSEFSKDANLNWNLACFLLFYFPSAGLGI